MKHFKGCSFVAALILSSFFALRPLRAQNANPKDFETSTAGVVIKGAIARIGVRSSQREGEISSLRWLSRLMKKYPRQSNYRVEWQSFERDKKRACVTSYDSKTATLTLLQIPLQTTTFRMYFQSWLPVSRGEIIVVAKRNGTLSDFN